MLEQRAQLWMWAGNSTQMKLSSDVMYASYLTHVCSSRNVQLKADHMHVADPH